MVFLRRRLKCPPSVWETILGRPVFSNMTHEIFIRVLAGVRPCCKSIGHAAPLCQLPVVGLQIGSPVISVREQLVWKMADEKKNATTTQEFYLPPPQLSKWESFKIFFYNKERGEVMGRDGSSWAKIGLFYLIFYAALAAFFAVMLVIFYQTLHNFEPKWKLDSSLIGTNPGLGFRPMPGEKNVESTLIWFQHGSTGNWQPWVDRLNTFMADYEEGRQLGGAVQGNCGFDRVREKDRICYPDIKNLGDNCTREKNFGYDQGHPCVMIKMNRIYGWVPVPYNSTDLPAEMPQDLRAKVKSFKPDASMIWVSCEGENPADKENIGPIQYKPEQGFPAYYFPFTNAKNYLSPFVSVQFLKPVTGVLINIECRAWAQNIEHNRIERRGSVHFELLMD